MGLTSFITLPRVRVLKETNELYTVRYGDEKYDIGKATASYFESQQPSTELRLEQRIALAAETDIFQDDKVPASYKEVMMFHEIREQEYVQHGLEDAHERAMNDEVLYVLKHFDAQTRDGYLAWARTYREEHVAVRTPQEKPWLHYLWISYQVRKPPVFEGNQPSKYNIRSLILFTDERLYEDLRKLPVGGYFNELDVEFCKREHSLTAFRLRDFQVVDLMRHRGIVDSLKVVTDNQQILKELRENSSHIQEGLLPKGVVHTPTVHFYDYRSEQEFAARRAQLLDELQQKKAMSVWGTLRKI